MGLRASKEERYLCMGNNLMPRGDGCERIN